MIYEKREYKDFLKIAWPAAAQGFLMDLLSSVDLAMVGSLGSNAQAAIGITSQPKMMTLILARALSVSLTAVLARRYGEGKKEEMRRILKQSLFITGIIYTIILSLAIIFFDKILSFSGAQTSYFTDAMTYGRILFFSLFFYVGASLLNSALIAIGNTKVLFISNVIGNLTNCFVNYTFIYGKFGFKKLGVLGVGLGTIIGSLVTFSIILYVIQFKEKDLRLDLNGWLAKKKDLEGLIGVSKGSLSEQIFERLGMYLYTIMVARLGAIQLAVHHISMNLCDVFYSLAIGLGTATASITGKKLGQKDIEGAVRNSKIGQNIGVIVAIIGFLTFILFRIPMLRIFSQEEVVLNIGSKILIIVAIVSFPETFSLVNSGVLKGAGDTKYVAAYSLVIIAFLRPLISYLLVFVFDMGLMGAWIALLIDQSLRALAASLRVRSRKWTKVKI